MIQDRHLPISSLAFMQANMAGDKTVDVPEGLAALTESEKQLWELLTKARVPSDWSEAELFLVHKACKLETKIRKLEQIVDKMGEAVFTERGDLKLNPYATVLDKYQRQQVVYVRAIGIYAGAENMSKSRAGREFNSMELESPLLAS